MNYTDATNLHFLSLTKRNNLYQLINYLFEWVLEKRVPIHSFICWNANLESMKRTQSHLLIKNHVSEI